MTFVEKYKAANKALNDFNKSRNRPLPFFRVLARMWGL